MKNKQLGPIGMFLFLLLFSIAMYSCIANVFLALLGQ